MTRQKNYPEPLKGTANIDGLFYVKGDHQVGMAGSAHALVSAIRKRPEHRHSEAATHWSIQLRGTGEIVDVNMWIDLCLIQFDVYPVKQFGKDYIVPGEGIGIAAPWQLTPEKRNSQDLWIGVSRDLLITS
jgi:hypothetical protein